MSQDTKSQRARAASVGSPAMSDGPTRPNGAGCVFEALQHDRRIETFDDDIAFVCFEERDDAIRKAHVAGNPALDLDDEGHPPRDLRQEDG